MNIDINFGPFGVTEFWISTLISELPKFRFWISILISELPNFRFWISILISELPKFRFWIDINLIVIPFLVSRSYIYLQISKNWGKLSLSYTTRISDTCNVRIHCCMYYTLAISQHLRTALTVAIGEKSERLGKSQENSHLRVHNYCEIYSQHAVRCELQCILVIILYNLHN